MKTTLCAILAAGALGCAQPLPPPPMTHDWKPCALTGPIQFSQTLYRFVDGRWIKVEPGCDLDCDGDVDLEDFAEMQRRR